MAFIQVTYVWFDPERLEQSPSANPEKQFLLEAQLRAAAVEFACDPSMNWKIRHIIAV